MKPKIMCTEDKKGLHSSKREEEHPQMGGWVRMEAMLRRWWPPSPVPDGFLLRLGEFQSVAEDLDSLLFMTESTCLGRLTADTEQMPIGSQRASQRQDTTWLTQQRSWRSRVDEIYRHTAHTWGFCLPFTELLGPVTHSLSSSKSLGYY